MDRLRLGMKYLTSGYGCLLAMLAFIGCYPGVSYAATGIEYRLGYDPATSTYQVYMRATAAPAPSQVMTSQVTIKVPHNAGSPFTVSNFTSVIGTWNGASSVVSAPSEDPNYDYFSFDLDGFGTDFGFIAGQEKLVFTFQNSGTCSGAATIMEDTDPFNIPGNSAGTNPGNEISLFAWIGVNLNGNDYLGTYGGPAKCQGIEYRLGYNAAADAYTVYMRPTVTPAPSNVMTSQVTIKVAHDATHPFTIANFSNLTGTWNSPSSRVDAPTEASAYDYLSFDLASFGSNFNFAAGVEQPVFSFKNSQVCGGDAVIMEDWDPFNIPSNSAGTNPGNEISVLLWVGVNPNDNDYIGTYGGPARCQGIEYRLAYNTATNLYEVYMRPNATPTPNSNVLTSQVTIKVPHDTANPFTVGSFTNVVGSWTPSSTVDRAPAEAPAYDYISFDLASVGTNFNFVSGIEQLVFSFANAGGCAGPATILDNATDPFNVQPNSVGSNPGNQISIMPWSGMLPAGNDYLHNYGSAAYCPPDVTLSATPLSVTEGGSTTVTATLAVATNQDVTVNLTYTNITTSVGDYVASPVSITIPAGQTSASVTVSTAQDTLDEANETFQIGVASVVNGMDKSTPQTITIVDDDPMPTATLNATASVTEGGNAMVTATLSGATYLPVTVNLVYTDGTAGASDYTKSPLSITIPAGQLSASVNVATTQDTLDEANETFQVNASSVVNAINGATAQTVTIVDDDPAPTLTLTATTPNVPEGGSATLTVSLNTASGQTVTVNLAYFSVTAVSGSDYIASPVSVTIPAGQTSVAVSIATIQDVLVEGNETFFVDVGSLTNATNGATSQTITIIDDDVLASYTVPIKVFLQGAYDSTTGKMRDSLRTLPNYPLTEPYSGLGYTYTGGGSGVSTSLAVLGNSDPNNAIVDWVVVELRTITSPAVTPTTVVASKAALLQRDGDVVSPTDGVSSLNFTGLAGSQYYMLILHRNHLGVMTRYPVTLSASTPRIDFSAMPDSQIYGSNAEVSLGGGVKGLWAGDGNRSRSVIASGPNNDVGYSELRVLVDPGNPTFDTNFVVNAYDSADVNLDGKVIAVGPGNDKGVIQVNVLSHPLNTSRLVNFIINKQYP